MTRPTAFKIAGVTGGLAVLVLLFQNCSNKKDVNLESAIKYAQERSFSSVSVDPKNPILLKFTDAPDGGPVGTYTNGQVIYATVSAAGTNGMVCAEKDAQQVCLSNLLNPSYWSDLYRSGWSENRAQNKWSRQLNVGTDVTAGIYRYYFVRPKSDDPTKANNFGSVEIKIQ